MWSISFSLRGGQLFFEIPDPQSHPCPILDSQVTSSSRPLDAYRVTSSCLTTQPSCSESSIPEYPRNDFIGALRLQTDARASQGKQVYESHWKEEFLKCELSGQPLKFKTRLVIF